MPPQTKKSGLAAKAGAKIRESHEAHKADETKISQGGDLPPGIENGIAQLTDCYFDTFDKGDLKGEYYCYMAGVMVEPKTFTDKNGQVIEVAGRRTSLMPIPICDTPGRQSRKTLDDHLAYLYNEWRKLGVDTTGVDPDNLEVTAKAIEESGVFFKVRTWAGAKQEIVEKGGKFYVGDRAYPSEAAAKKANPYVGQEPRTQHDWRGAVEYNGEGVQNAVEDNTDAGGEEEAPAKPTGKPAAKTTPKAGAKKAPEPEPEAAAEEVDFDTLGTEADGGDKAAIKQLTALAREAGIADDDIENAASWSALAEQLKGGGGEAGGDEAAADDWKPQKTEVYKYKPKGAKKPVECEVTAVFEDKQTVNLRNLDDKEMYKSVAWTELESA